MKKRIISLVMMLCIVFSLSISASATSGADAETATPARITRPVDVSATITKEATILNRKIVFTAICKSTVHVNDSNNEISYFAPVQMQVRGMPSDIKVIGYHAGETEYDFDPMGTAEQRGTLTVLVPGHGNWYIDFNAHAQIKANGTVGFGVF